MVRGQETATSQVEQRASENEKVLSVVESLHCVFLYPKEKDRKKTIEKLHCSKLDSEKQASQVSGKQIVGLDIFLIPTLFAI